MILVTTLAAALAAPSPAQQGDPSDVVLFCALQAGKEQGSGSEAGWLGSGPIQMIAFQFPFPSGPHVNGDRVRVDDPRGLLEGHAIEDLQQTDGNLGFSTRDSTSSTVTMLVTRPEGGKRSAKALILRTSLPAKKVTNAYVGACQTVPTNGDANKTFEDVSSKLRGAHQ